jgi:hypothetical protein
LRMGQSSSPSSSGRTFKTAIMQPYFLPYVGYYQLIASVDLFIIYDNIQYTKKGWINRNRHLRDGQAVLFSLPLKSDSDFLEIRERTLSDSFSRDKLLNQLASAYRRAPQFSETFPLVERIVRYPESNLFGFLEHSIIETCEHLGISTEIRRSSRVAIDHRLKSQDKVLALCEAVGASVYINAIGGTQLYSNEVFQSRGIELKFIRPMPLDYAQLGAEFIPWLSIVDVLMFNPLSEVRRLLRTNYELV